MPVRDRIVNSLVDGSYPIFFVVYSIIPNIRSFLNEKARKYRIFSTFPCFLCSHFSQSLTSKIVGIEINKNIVTSNYSYAHLKSGIGILNIDIIVESVPSSAEIDILYTGFRPTMNLYINTVNSDGNHITIHINTNGIVKLYSDTPGKFGIRTQFIIV